MTAVGPAPLPLDVSIAPPRPAWLPVNVDADTASDAALREAVSIAPPAFWAVLPVNVDLSTVAAAPPWCPLSMAPPELLAVFCANEAPLIVSVLDPAVAVNALAIAPPSSAELSVKSESVTTRLSPPSLPWPWLIAPPERSLVFPVKELAATT